MSDLGITRLKRPQSLTMAVTEEVRNLIITNRIALGQQLSEGELAEQLGVSRSPVREAFQRLEMEKLVEIRPQRGTFVFEYDLNDLREISQVREVIETGALRIAIENDSEGLCRTLRTALEEAETALAKGPAGYQAYDSAFHEALVRASGNGELVDAYMRVSGRIRAIRYRLTRTDHATRSAQKDHRAITELVLAGKYREAEERLGRHVYNGYRVFLATVSGGGEGDVPPGTPAAPSGDGD